MGVEIGKQVANWTAAIDRQEKGVLYLMAGKYKNAWQAVQKDIDSLCARIMVKVSAGEDFPVSWLHQQAQFVQVRDRLEAELVRSSDDAAVLIQQKAMETAKQSTKAAESYIKAAFPTEAKYLSGLSVRSFQALAGQLSFGPLREILSQVSSGAVQELEKTLLWGISTGTNPMVLARMMKTNIIGGAFARVQTIARTEIMRAWRGGTLKTYQDSGVVKEWAWHCAPTACAICHALHGKRFPLTEPMSDHPRGRCMQVAVTKTWDELIAEAGKKGHVDETAAHLTPHGNFQRLALDKQKAILGNTRYGWYKSGKLTLDDMINVKVDPSWGPQFRLRRIKDLKGYVERGTHPAPWKIVRRGMPAPLPPIEVPRLPTIGIPSVPFPSAAPAAKDSARIIREIEEWGGSTIEQEKRLEAYFNLKLAELEAKYPVLSNTTGDKFRDIKLMHKKIDAGVWANTNGTNKVTWNSQYIKSEAGFEELKKGLAKSLETGWHPKGCDTVKSIIDHELGHDFHLRLGRLKPGEWNYYRATQIRKALLGKGYKLADMKARLSLYAKKNGRETFAEAFSQWINAPEMMDPKIRANLEAILQEVSSW